MLDGGILSLIGDTPLLRLDRLFKDAPFAVYAKLEGMNPGGSIKDRTALEMVNDALSTGEIKPGSVVIESSSGNQGIGLSQACSYHGLRFVCVVDPNAQAQNVKIMRAYGAEISAVTEPDPETQEWLPARLKRVESLLATIPNSVWLEQYRNPYNPIAHHRTMKEIVDALGGKVDHIYCAVSTCGTVRGCAEYARAAKLGTTVVAVDVLGSAIFGSPPQKRLLSGMGAGVIPPLCYPAIIDKVMHVSDLECVTGSRRLAVAEAILAGASSGGVVTALERSRGEISAGSNVVLMMPDRGERYLETVFSDEWVAKNFGDVSHLWGGRKQG